MSSSNLTLAVPGGAGSRSPNTQRRGSEASISIEQLKTIAEGMRQNVKVRDRTHRFKTYKRCFVGEKAVRWMIEAGFAKDAKEAVTIGNVMLSKGWFLHVVNPDHVFENSYLFYRWAEDNMPTQRARDKAIAKGISMPSLSADEDSGQWDGMDTREETTAAIVGEDVQKIEAVVNELKNILHTIERECRVERLTLLMLLPVAVLLSFLGLMTPTLTLISAALASAWLLRLLRSQKQRQEEWEIKLNVVADLIEGPVLPAETEAAGGPQQEQQLSAQKEGPDDPFYVPDEELHRMRVALDDEFPDSASHLDDFYIRAVMKTPDKKKQTQRRTFAYAKNKLVTALQLYEDLRPFEVTPESLGKTIECGSLYWYGYTEERQPILWVRPMVKDYDNLDLDKERLLHMFMIETGVKFMPPGVTSFCIIGEAGGMGLGQVRPKLMKAILSLIMNGYPDRLGRVYAGPANLFLRTMYRLIRPLIPAYMANKITLLAKADELAEKLPSQYVPPRCGGKQPHACLKEDENGNVTFDYHTMVRDMEKMKAEVDTASPVADSKK